MFITQDDIHAKMRASDLRQITVGNDTIVLSAIAYAEGKVKSILLKRYDVDKLYAKQKDEREGLLISICVDIAIYEIVSLAQPNIDLTDRRERALMGIEYLNDIAEGKHPVAWPLVEDKTHIDNPVVSGGRAPRGNRL